MAEGEDKSSPGQKIEDFANRHPAAGAFGGAGLGMGIGGAIWAAIMFGRNASSAVPSSLPGGATVAVETATGGAGEGVAAVGGETALGAALESGLAAGGTVGAAGGLEIPVWGWAATAAAFMGGTAYGVYHHYDELAQRETVVRSGFRNPEEKQSSDILGLQNAEEFHFLQAKGAERGFKSVEQFVGMERHLSHGKIKNAHEVAVSLGYLTPELRQAEQDRLRHGAAPDGSNLATGELVSHFHLKHDESQKSWGATWKDEEGRVFHSRVDMMRDANSGAAMTLVSRDDPSSPGRVRTRDVNIQYKDGTRITAESHDGHMIWAAVMKDKRTIFVDPDKVDHRFKTLVNQLPVATPQVDFSLASRDNFGTNPDLLRQMQEFSVNALDAKGNSYLQYEDVAHAKTDSERIVRVWQHFLHDNGHGELKIDGKMGGDTRQATRQFLAAHTHDDGGRANKGHVAYEADGRGAFGTAEFSALNAALPRIVEKMTADNTGAVTVTTQVSEIPLKDPLPPVLRAVTPLPRNNETPLAALPFTSSRLPPLPESLLPNKAFHRNHRMLGGNLAAAVADNVAYGTEKKHDLSTDASGNRVERWIDSRGEKITVVQSADHKTRDSAIEAADGTLYTRHDESRNMQWSMVQTGDGIVVSNVVRSEDGTSLTEQVKQPPAMGKTADKVVVARGNTLKGPSSGV